jgi:alkylation response protein AidB-like acyl-CoA dehydrogenase
VENFLTDNPDILFHLEHLELDRIIHLIEDDFADKDRFAHAPVDVADAKDSYRRILELVGEISAEYIAPYAAEVDEQGVKLENGEVTLAPATRRALDMMAKADLMGFCLPREYGGLNCPVILLSIAAEIVSRADGSFLNFGLQQDIGATINKFGDAEQKRRILPRLASGEVGSSMILTEPDAGSDLQAVNLKATIDASGRWVLNGVKRFITNGCGEIGLVLCRSEEGSKGAGGLSFFLYERDKHMTIRRVERKLGIHGSATCELQFANAPAELVGQRRRGLTKYTLWLMNSARLGVAAQAVGIAEAAYREARKYASERVQFEKPIIEFPPVFEMLSEMRVAIEAGRALLYETARFVDLKEGLEHIAETHPEREEELKSDTKKYTRLAYMFTPMAKLYNTEMANKAAYDAIQIHGGTGYMREFNVERHYRDARITNIYEGTSQLQVVAAIGAITSGTASSILDEYDEADCSHAPELLKMIRRARNCFEKANIHVKERDDETVTVYHSRRLVEMATDVAIGYLLVRDAKYAQRKMKVAEMFVSRMLPRVEAAMSFIMSDEATLLKNYKDVIA